MKEVIFFQLLFGCPTASFGPLLRGQPHSLNCNDCVIQFQPESHQEPRNYVESLSPAKCLKGFKLGNFQFHHKVLTH